MEEIKLYDLDSGEFTELIENRRKELKNKNLECRKSREEFHELMKDYPKLQLILEYDRELILNELECKMLQKLVSIYSQILDYEEREIFFLGAKENYFYLKNLGLIKE